LDFRSDKNAIEFAGWKLFFYDEGNKTDLVWREQFTVILPLLENPENVLKHDHRSLVGTVTVNDVRYVVKKFILQRTWLWFQFTSLFFATLGEVAFKNAVELSKLGILTPKPLLLMQKMMRGMVVECWLVYPFMEGDLVSEKDVKEIVGFVRRMHEAGWIHRDPHRANFIRTPLGLATIDPIRARQSNSRYLRAYDVMHMSHDMPSAPDVYGRDKLGIYFKLAVAGHSGIRLYRLVKSGLRRLLGLPKHSAT
jgi:hypothetical protein